MQPNSLESSKVWFQSQGMYSKGLPEAILRCENIILFLGQRLSHYHQEDIPDVETKKGKGIKDQEDDTDLLPKSCCTIYYFNVCRGLQQTSDIPGIPRCRFTQISKK